MVESIPLVVFLARKSHGQHCKEKKSSGGCSTSVILPSKSPRSSLYLPRPLATLPREKQKMHRGLHAWHEEMLCRLRGRSSQIFQVNLHRIDTYRYYLPDIPRREHSPTLGWFEGSMWAYMTNMACLGLWSQSSGALTPEALRKSVALVKINRLSNLLTPENPLTPSGDFRSVAPPSCSCTQRPSVPRCLGCVRTKTAAVFVVVFRTFEGFTKKGWSTRQWP